MWEVKSWIWILMMSQRHAGGKQQWKLTTSLISSERFFTVQVRCAQEEERRFDFTVTPVSPPQDRLSVRESRRLVQPLYFPQGSQGAPKIPSVCAHYFTPFRFFRLWKAEQRRKRKATQWRYKQKRREDLWTRRKKNVKNREREVIVNM